MKTFKEWVKLEEAPYSPPNLINSKLKTIGKIDSPINNERKKILAQLALKAQPTSNNGQ